MPFTAIQLPSPSPTKATNNAASSQVILRRRGTTAITAVAPVCVDDLVTFISQTVSELPQATTPPQQQKNKGKQKKLTKKKGSPEARESEIQNQT